MARSLFGKDVTGFPNGVVDENVARSWISPPPAQDCVEGQAKEDGSREHPVNQGDLAFRPQHGIVKRGPCSGLSKREDEHDPCGQSRPCDPEWTVSSVIFREEHGGALHSQV